MLDCGDEGLAADDEAEPLRWYATPAEAAARLRTGALRWPPDAGDARGPLRPPDAGPFAAPFRDDGRVGPRRDGEAPLWCPRVDGRALASTSAPSLLSLTISEVGPSATGAKQHRSRRFCLPESRGAGLVAWRGWLWPKRPGAAPWRDGNASQRCPNWKMGR